MKTFIWFIGCFFISSHLFAQGTVNFANGAAGVNAPINLYGSQLASTNNGPWMAMLFAGPAGTPAADLTDSIVSGSPAMVGGTAPGYVFGGLRTIAGIASGSQAVLQIRVWHVAFWGESYPTAANLDSYSPAFGVSAPITITLGGGPTPTPNMVGLMSFNVAPIPEPAPFVFAMVGFLLFILFRHK